jgi:hypothetical protein
MGKVLLPTFHSKKGTTDDEHASVLMLCVAHLVCFLLHALESVKSSRL